MGKSRCCLLCDQVIMNRNSNAKYCKACSRLDFRQKDRMRKQRMARA